MRPAGPEPAFTANFDIASHSVGSSGSESTTTNTFGANSNESLTKTQSPTGAAQSFTYGTQGRRTSTCPARAPMIGATTPPTPTTVPETRCRRRVRRRAAGVVELRRHAVSGLDADRGRQGRCVPQQDQLRLHRQAGGAITPVTGAGLGVRNYSCDIYGG